MSTVGVLALQGDFREHQALLESLGADVVRVKEADELDTIDALVVPGGESTVMDKLTRSRFSTAEQSPPRSIRKSRPMRGFTP